MFYYLLSGADDLEREKLRLGKPEDYFYLRQVRQHCFKTVIGKKTLNLSLLFRTETGHRILSQNLFRTDYIKVISVFTSPNGLHLQMDHTDRPLSQEYTIKP